MSALHSKQIKLKEVVKTFENKAGHFNVLQGIDLEIGQKEFVVITGKSGSGKSTLLNIITGIDRPTSGLITIDGTDIHLLKDSELADWRGRSIGIVFQFFQLMPTLTVLENVMLPMDFRNVIPGNKRKSRAMDLLDQTDVAIHANKLPGLLSGGEQQRVAIARALANNPSIIVADEPTGNLDSVTSGKIMNFFGDLVTNGKTVVIVTHEKNMIINAGRYVTVADGRIVNNDKAKGESS